MNLIVNTFTVVMPIIEINIVVIGQCTNRELNVATILRMKICLLQQDGAPQLLQDPCLQKICKCFLFTQGCLQAHSQKSLEVRDTRILKNAFN